MKIYKYRSHYETYGIAVYKASYQLDDSLAIVAIIASGPEKENLFAHITVNLRDNKLKENQAYADTNNLPDIANWLEEKGLAKNTGKTKQIGFCTYPLMEFYLNKIENLED